MPRCSSLRHTVSAAVCLASAAAPLRGQVAAAFLDVAERAMGETPDFVQAPIHMRTVSRYASIFINYSPAAVAQFTHYELVRPGHTQVAAAVLRQRIRDSLQLVRAVFEVRDLINAKVTSPARCSPGLLLRELWLDQTGRIVWDKGIRGMPTEVRWRGNGLTVPHDLVVDVGRGDFDAADAGDPNLMLVPCAPEQFPVPGAPSPR
jgi:hypothetical protein